ncbi:MAG: hypothetical protein KF768_10635 [Phycisphaeraceae bacterium]|nr:hypothetical protein [Phycisphaeraceae bacterium]
MKAILLLCLSVVTLPGCIAWEIRDEIRATNQHLKEMDPVLLNTRGLLATVNEDIRRTNEQLDAVRADLAGTREQLAAVESSLETANPKLFEVNSGLDRMQVLSEVHASLQRVEAHLGPLSRTMGSLGGTLSWLGMGGEDTGTDLLASGSQAAPSGAGAATDSQAAEEGAVGASRPQRDLLIGTWLLEFPPPSPPQVSPAAFVIKPDGTFLRAEPGKPLVTGTWSRVDRTLTLTSDQDAPSAVGSTPAARGKPQTTALAANTPTEFELLSVTLRTLTLRKDDEIRVFTRP